MSGEGGNVELLLSHYSNKDLNGAKVQWQSTSGIKGQRVINHAIDRATVTPIATATFIVPETSQPRRERLTVEVRGRDGKLIAENSYDLFVYPKAQPAKNATVIFYDP